MWGTRLCSRLADKPDASGRRNVFERYTQAARTTIFWAVYMARQVGSEKIETEHLLLGLLRSDQALAKRFLSSPWAAETVWKRIEEIKPKSERVPGPKEIPLSIESKRALACAAEEADLFSSRHVCTEHLLLGLLREDTCLAGKILSELSVRFGSTRDELLRSPHDDSRTEEFTRERGALPQDVVELQGRVHSIRARLEDAISSHDFDRARACSNEELVEGEKLLALYDKYGLINWIFD
jgi:ATP-dependent Clp protease ATP-binding subunit ClpA